MNCETMKPQNCNSLKRPVVAILADFPWSYFERGAEGRGGGQAATWLSQLAEELSKYTNEFNFNWLTIDRSRSVGVTESREWQGQTFHRIIVTKTTFDLNLNYLPSRWRLGSSLATIRPDLLHVWGTERSYPIVAGWRQTPTILSMQGILTEYQRIGSFDGSRFWNRLASWEPRFLRASDVVTSESKWGIEKIKNIVPEADVRQVEYGVHPSFYKIKWEPELDDRYAIYSGSIDTRKGVDTLVDALELLPQRNWTLKIAGGGPLGKELANRGIPGIQWLGVLPWSELQHQLSHALCLVLPTRADTSPNVSKEARVIGLPVITTRDGGQAGYIRDGENGVLVNPLNARNLAAAMDRIMSDPETAITMGKCRHAEDRDYFLPEKTAAGFLEIYRQMINRKTG